MKDTSVTLYAALSKPNSMLGQAACKAEEKKESISRRCDTQHSTVNMHTCRKINQGLSQTFAGCVLNVYIWTHTYTYVRDKQILSAIVVFVKVFWSFQ